MLARVIVWVCFCLILLLGFMSTYPMMLNKPLYIVSAWAGILGAGGLVLAAKVRNLLSDLGY